MTLQTGIWAAASKCLLFTSALLGAVIGASTTYAQCSPQEVATLTASDGGPAELFGWAVSVDENTIAVGAPKDEDNGPSSGSAYVFERSSSGSNNWIQIAKLLPSDGASEDFFGYSLSISGDTIVVGALGDSDNGLASGSTYIFERDWGGANKWGQVAKLLASDGNEFDLFGKSVSVSGELILVGAYQGETNGLPTGAAYVFERNLGGTNNWGQVAKLVASDGSVGDWFGDFVAISDETAVIGADGHDYNGQQSGAAYIFERNAGGTNSWGQVAKLLALDGTSGDQFGSVAISQDLVLVGASTDDQNGQYAGSAYVFGRKHGGPNKWGQIVKILPSDGQSPDQFGAFLSILNDTAVVGSIRDASNGLESGSAYVFYRDMGGSNKWGQVAKIYPSGASPFDAFGIPAMSIDAIVIGAKKSQVPGAVYIFDRRFPFPPATYCTAKPASFPDCVPAIQGIGVASASALSGFTVQTRKVPGQVVGVFLYTHTGVDLPIHGPFGTLCINPRLLFRTGPLFSGGSSTNCDGILTIDWNSFAHTVVLADPASTQPGTPVDGQFWYRDRRNPGGANLSDAIAFVVCR